ncbi:MAG: HU family DNA-binding protein [Jhaorihella sp.]
MTTSKAKPTTAARKAQAGRTAATSGTKAPKPAAPKPAARKTAAGNGATPTVVKVSAPVVASADMKKKELIALVTERSGAKKKDAKPVVEAMLAVLGEALASGRELNLAPLGKMRINRVEDKANGRIIVCKLRQPKDTSSGPKVPPKDPLAEAAE